MKKHGAGNDVLPITMQWKNALSFTATMTWTESAADFLEIRLDH